MKAKIAIILGSILLIATTVVAQQPAPPAQPPQPDVLPGHPAPAAPGDFDLDPQERPPAQPVQPGMPPMHAAPGVPGRPAMPDPLDDVMFPPDMILGHARELNLTDEQKAFMRGEVQRTMTTFNELQWKLQDQMELLHGILKAQSINEEEALAQLNRVLDTEREIKRLHVGLAVRIKNRLTPQQQEQLHVMRMGQHMSFPVSPGDAPRPIQ
jgi:Spy/CpxP family protein refolding chaperone